ncbi:MAG: CDP-alcohol phosphatidyltransferase family protein [Bacillota bacterium]|nr:CDP-alcohol phosphatidyltransferase family protein [Bacillota bacterium]
MMSMNDTDNRELHSKSSAPAALAASAAGKIDFTPYRLSNNMTLPNLLSLLRLALIPLMLYYVFQERPLAAALVVLASGLTDILDGWIARHFNQITPLGKMLDPLADKLTQLALAVVLCLAHHMLIPLVLILAVKELLMLLMGLRLLRAGKQPFSACWWGKLATAVFYAGIIAILLFSRQLQPPGVTAISFIISLLLIYSMIRYKNLYDQKLNADD